ncbi:LuxR C-terminal-related transcriptional regulator [Sphaerisporangium sp. TRM90804]|uniref:ATP-binding protein n=1 Tax=Sphaerisporangium sp. TRM90804 TaxID=3031113 RepID=UPI00244738CD|nr:LuxR C-terminal-related transcriptional regulator [Sphaerisporangium sp. TRM90804]MDH2428918.1 LuxR C-terminal-related transcriptional regulator [Sphaerisporangium sp. TRM90804]
MTFTPRQRRGHGLPAEMTSFVGRRRELAELRTLLSRSRLVTLTGVGGVGKTRLACRFADEVRRAFPGGVWLVELSELRGDGLVQALADALELDGDARAPLEAIVDHLGDRKTLLILDNCEHALNDCAELAGELLAGVPELRLLVTSRQALGVAGEQTLTVPPLPVPERDLPVPSASSLAEVDAVRLFVERAAAVLPGFSVTEANREAVARICRRLDGIPLAIELAAVRLRALSVQQLLDRLDDRFRLLTAGSRAVPRHHRTLRSMVDWSHDLCTEPERLLWARASCFSGGLDLEAAEAVCSGDGIAREEVIGLVIGLVEKSVLLREEHPSGVRYRLLETIRRYGAERLAESGREAELRRRHRVHYAGLAREARAHLFSGSQVEWATRLRLEHANLRAALRSSLDGRPGEEDGLRMAADLLYHWKTSHHVREGRRWLEEALAVSTEAGEARARALWGDGWLAIIQGDLPGALVMLQESRELGEKLGLDADLAYVALYSGMAAMYQGDAEAAEKLYKEALAGHRECGDEAGTALTLIRLCLVYSYLGDSERALRVGEEALRMCEARGEGWHRAYAMMALGVEVWRRGDTLRAALLERESLRFNRSLGDWLGAGVNLEVLAWVAAGAGEYERAARLLGALRNIWKSAGAPLSGFGHLMIYHGECLATVRLAMGEAALGAAVERGARLSLDEALDYALSDREAAVAPAGEAPSPLTRRETEIAQLVARGLSNKEIAGSLVIAQRTAEGHIEHILGKLGFHSRAQIAVWVGDRNRAASAPGAAGAAEPG